MWGIGYLLAGLAVLWLLGIVIAVLERAVRRFRVTLRTEMAKAKRERGGK